MAKKRSKKGRSKKNNLSRRPGGKTNIASKKAASKNLYLIALAIAVFGFLLYANTLGHGYVLDDFSQIKENYVTKQGIDGIPTLWKTNARYGYRPGAGELYRPVPMSMFALEWQAMPDTPALGHFINVLLYALTGAVLFLTLARVMGKYNIVLPLLATLFFMAHPVHVEVVANIKSRDEIVMFLMCILTLNFLWRYLENENIKWAAAACFTYLVALFSKENAVTFLAIFPLFVYFFSDIKLKTLAVSTLPFIVLAGIFIYIRKEVVGAFGNPTDVAVLDNFLAGTENIGTRIASAFLILGKYLWTLVFPHPLGSDFGYNQIPLTGFGDWRVLLSLLAWLGMGLFAVVKFFNKNIWSFVILFFVINFSIFSNLIITIGTSYGDRLLYSASPAFAMALALFLMKINNEKYIENNGQYSFSHIFKNKKLWSVAAVVLILYSAKTFTRNQVWESSYTLYKNDIELSPNSAKLNFHYGLELVKMGKEENNPAKQKEWYGKAKNHFEKATKIYPKYHDAYGQLGLAYYREKNYKKALENYNLALKYRPTFPLVHSNMGIIYFEQGDLEKAKELYHLAVKEDPRMVDALRNLGAVYAMQRNFKEAIKWFKEGLKYDPNNPTLNHYLGSAYSDAGQPEKGKPFLEKARELGN
ncbi:MAG TPA: tetratricopeptide repeat protein [Bacteroidetes bacterium]|nr:tetratricopeptide repeat protein [Bacteroidota bacterium]